MQEISVSCNFTKFIDYSIMHLQTMIVLLPFQFGFLYFFFLSDCHGSPPNSMLNWSGKSGHPYLVPEFRGKSFSFHCSDDVSCGLAINSLYNVEICSLCTYFDENFCHEWMLNFVKCFLVGIMIIMWFLSFFYVVYHIDWWILSHLCIPGVNRTGL